MAECGPPLDSDGSQRQSRSVLPMRMGQPASRTDINSMRKAEVVALLEDYGLPFSPAWTVGELKQTAKEHLFPKNDSSALRSMRSLNGLKKADLIRKAEEVGANTTQHMNAPQLRLSIRQAILARTTPEGGDFMGFGKHATKTYQQVKDLDESYCAWAVKECDMTSGPEFIRFVSWLNSATVALAAVVGAMARPSGPQYELKAPRQS